MGDFQAKKGGEYGLNGEWYKGGQFLPSSENTEKGSIKIHVKKGKKSEIAPYVWDKSPADNMVSIYERIYSWCEDNRQSCDYVSGEGFVGFRFLAPKPTYMHREIINVHPYEKITHKPIDKNRREYLVDMIERFNNGERWISIYEDPYHYKNI